MKRKIPIATIVILLLNVAGLIYEINTGERPAMYNYAMYRGALEDGGYLRAVVSAFLHFGFAHFASNMICLAIYGFTLERQIGSLKYTLVYAAALVGSALLINFAGGDGLHAGASGGIWGLMTATLVYSLRNKINPMYALRGIIINLVYSFSAGVSWQAHIGGGIGGLLLALAICRGNTGYRAGYGGR